MINSVRNTVLAIANKNNYGYISPQDFNLYAQQAQMDLFEDYFYQYNAWTNKENQRLSGSGYADIVKGLVEVIDSFSVTRSLAQQGANLFNLPSDYYLINKILPTGSNYELEQVSNSKINLLLASSLTAPTTGFPAFDLFYFSCSILSCVISIKEYNYFFYTLYRKHT